MRRRRRGGLGLALILAAALYAAGCAFPLYTLFVADDGFAAPDYAADTTAPAGPDGWQPELKIGATYPGPIPRPVLELRMQGVVRIEARENFLRHAGQLIGRAATPVGQADYPLPVGELAWYALSHQLHPAPYRIVGSGFFVHDGGYIATNDHVIDMPGDLVVKTWDGRIYPAKRLGRDPINDLAILKIETRAAYPVLPLGDNRALARGDYLLALGHPFGFDLTLTQGIVSGLGRPAGVTAFDWMIQTDADINPGNSGGPLLNAAGEVVGINDAAYLWGSKAGFALPADLLTAHLNTLIWGYTPEMLAAFCFVEPIDDRLRAADHLPIWTGLKVHAAFAAAREAGLQPGDLIFSADEQPIRTVYDWAHALRLKEPYQTLKLKVLRAAPPPADKPTAQPIDPHPGYVEVDLQFTLEPAD